MSNEGDIHILHRQSAINYCVNKILKLLLVRKFAAQVYMRMFNCAYLKVKRLKLTMQNCMHRQMCVCLSRTYIKIKIKLNFALGCHD